MTLRAWTLGLSARMSAAKIQLRFQLVAEVESPDMAHLRSVVRGAAMVSCCCEHSTPACLLPSASAADGVVPYASRASCTSLPPAHLR